MNVALDHVDPDQRIDGYKTLNLLNCHEDPTFLHTVLYSEIARHYIPAPKANFVRLVINGESWGLYVNAQQFDKKFLLENYGTSEGARWKVPGNPGADGGLRYLGDDIAEYKRRFEIKTKDDKAQWKALIALCKSLNQTPIEQLEEALKPILDVDGVLWFLALENVVVNNDGYWTLRQRLQPLSRSAREVPRHPPRHERDLPGGDDVRSRTGFWPPRIRPRCRPRVRPSTRARCGGLGGPRPGPRPRPGPGFGPGPPPAPRDLDPLVGLDDARKPLRSRLLAVPGLKARYLSHVRTLAERWLDWETLGPLVKGYRSLIEQEVSADTKKQSSFASFERSLVDSLPDKAEPARGLSQPSLRAFADARRRDLLSHPEVLKAGPEPAGR